MAKSQRQKGLRNENKVTKMHHDIGITATRISAPYKAGADLLVELPGLAIKGEVKARANAEGWKTLKGWFGESDALFLIEDREQPLVCLRWDTYRRLVTQKEARDGPDDPVHAMPASVSTGAAT
jgi:hypothetical protein